MAHTPLALLLQFLVYLASQDAWIGAAAGAAYFIGREYAQAEYRLIEHHYGGLRANMPTLAPLWNARAWTRKALLDWLLPTVAVYGVAALVPVS